MGRWLVGLMGSWEPEGRQNHQQGIQQGVQQGVPVDTAVGQGTLVAGLEEEVLGRQGEPDTAAAVGRAVAVDTFEDGPEVVGSCVVGEVGSCDPGCRWPVRY